MNTMTLSSASQTDRETQRRLGYDKLIFQLILAQLPIVALLAPIGYGTFVGAIIAALVLGGVTTLAYARFKGTPLFGILSGPIIMAISVIAIQAQLGRIEMHFHIFGALALLLIFKDWRPVLSAAGFIAVHHLIFTALQLGEVTIGGMPIMIFNYGCNWGITFLHAAFVVFEAAILMYYALLMEKEQQRSDELVEAVSKVQATHDLTIRVAADESNDVAQAFNGLLTDFEGVIKDITAVTGELSNISTSMVSAGEETRENVANQSNQIGNARDTMAEMSRAIQDVAKNAQVAATITQTTDEDTRNGARMVGDAVSSSEKLMNSMNQTSESIESLNAAAKRIEMVVTVIRDISEQTNLLALNAAIEAARAGEQGRGFAVVSDEVRELAERTRQSTEEIQEIIASLQSLTSGAVKDINVGLESSAQTSNDIARAGEVLGSIAESISQISEMNAINASSAEEQSATSHAISDNIQLIAELSAGTVSNIEANQQIASQLNELASGLQLQVSKFRSA